MLLLLLLFFSFLFIFFFVLPFFPSLLSFFFYQSALTYHSLMRRATSSYFFILAAVCIFYFGSLYLVSRTAVTDEPACFNVAHDDNKAMAQEETEIVIKPEENVFLDDKSTSDKSPVLLNPSTSNQEEQEGYNDDNDNDSTIREAYPTDENINATTATSIVGQPQDEDRANAAIVILCRNNELPAMRRTIREFEE